MCADVPLVFRAMAMSGVKEIVKKAQDEVANDSASDIRLGGSERPAKRSAVAAGSVERDGGNKGQKDEGGKGDSKHDANDNGEIGHEADAGQPNPQPGDMSDAQIEAIAMTLREAGDRIDRMFSNRVRRDTQILVAYAVFIAVVGLINLVKGGSSSANPSHGAGHGGQL